MPKRSEVKRKPHAIHHQVRRCRRQSLVVSRGISGQRKKREASAVAHGSDGEMVPWQVVLQHIS